MDTAAKIAWDDSVLPFQLDQADIRGRVARLDKVLSDVLHQHNYPPAVEALVAEMVLLSALIGPSVKLRWKLSLQLRSKNAAVRMIATDYYGPSQEGESAKIRAYASYDPARTAGLTPYDLLGEGYFAVIIDQGTDMQPYQGITPLVRGETLAGCAQTYFAQSEQLPTRFALSLRRAMEAGQMHWRAGGIMLQHMPQAGHHVRAHETSASAEASPRADDLAQATDTENWGRVNILLDTAREDELAGPDPTPDELLVRLFHQEAPRVFDPQPVRFGCTCSEARVRQSLSIYSAKDIASMTTSEGWVSADCQFCGAHYKLDPATVGLETSQE